MARNPQAEVVVGGRAKVASAVAQVTPRMLERQMARRTHKAMIEKSEPAPDTEGNLFAPVEFGVGVRGGWNRGRLAARLGSVLAVGGPAALGWLLWNSAKERAGIEERPAA